MVKPGCRWNYECEAHSQTSRGVGGSYECEAHSQVSFGCEAHSWLSRGVGGCYECEAHSQAGVSVKVMSVRLTHRYFSGVRLLTVKPGVSVEVV